MYVIRPTVSLAKSIPSYNFCATRIVLLLEKEILVEATCCNVLVLKGITPFLAFSLLVTSTILKSGPNFSITFCASSSFFNSTFLSLYFSNKASNEINLAVIVQYSSGINFSISRSRSTINFKATL